MIAHRKSDRRHVYRCAGELGGVVLYCQARLAVSLTTFARRLKRDKPVKLPLLRCKETLLQH
jgi:hypothetical protein